MQYFYLVIIIVLSYQKATGQVVLNNQIRAGYGPAIAGRGDILGHQFLLGVQNQLSRHGLIDVRLSGTLLERTSIYYQRYPITEKSNGIALEADYGYALHWGLLKFYLSIGPSIRYSNEVYSEYIAVYFDPSVTNQVSRFEAPVKDTMVLRGGLTSGLNFDLAVSDRITIGLRTSLQVYRGSTIYFMGLMLKNSKWN